MANPIETEVEKTTHQDREVANEKALKEAIKIQKEWEKKSGNAGSGDKVDQVLN